MDTKKGRIKKTSHTLKQICTGILERTSTLDRGENETPCQPRTGLPHQRPPLEIGRTGSLVIRVVKPPGAIEYTLCFVRKDVKQATGKIESTPRTSHALFQRTLGQADAIDARMERTLSVMVAWMDIPLYQMVIGLKQYSPGYPGPNCSTFRATIYNST